MPLTGICWGSCRRSSRRPYVLPTFMFDPKILTDEAVKDLVDVAGSVYTDSLELIPAEKVLENFHTGLGKLDPVVQAQFMRSVVDGLMLGYVNSIRDAAEKPILTEQQLASSMISLSLLSFMNPDEQERLKAAAAMSGALIVIWRSDRAVRVDQGRGCKQGVTVDVLELVSGVTDKDALVADRFGVDISPEEIGWVFDIGCGDGLWSRVMEDYAPTAKIYEYD